MTFFCFWSSSALFVMCIMSYFDRDWSSFFSPSANFFSWAGFFLLSSFFKALSIWLGSVAFRTYLQFSSVILKLKLLGTNKLPKHSQLVSYAVLHRHAQLLELWIVEHSVIKSLWQLHRVFARTDIRFSLQTLFKIDIFVQSDIRQMLLVFDVLQSRIVL